tara:strand:+ start:78680 stop:78967 length:288 start_codon:yes stop_codon:yes gene_type:complete
MSAGGHISDMMNRIKQNAILKNARRRKFKGGNDYSKTKNIKTTYDFPKFSSSEFKSFKKKVIKDALKENNIQTIYIISFIIVVILIFLIFNNYHV